MTLTGGQQGLIVAINLDAHQGWEGLKEPIEVQLEHSIFVVTTNGIILEILLA